MKDVLFVRNDGLFAVAHIDSAGELVETQVGDDATTDWTHVVAVGEVRPLSSRTGGKRFSSYPM
jgi:hypothetical protein